MAIDLAAHQARLIQLFDPAPIRSTYGMVLSYEGERAVFDLPYNPGFDHAAGAIHGGVFATLLDNAGWFAAAQRYEEWIVTVELTTRLLEAAVEEDLRAEGWIVRAGRRVAVARMEVRGADGRLVATGSGTFVTTGKPLAAKRASEC
jgi:uncharacterized protein (TIGR00369 family)